MENLSENALAEIVVDAAYQVHRTLGPGLLESAYEECLNYELLRRDLQVERQKPMPLVYGEVKLDAGYRVDLMINNKIIVEINAVEALSDVHLGQVLTYLKLAKCKLGLLINFNVALVKNGIKRIVNNL